MSRPRKLIFLILLVPALARADSDPGPREWKPFHYRFRILLSDSTNRIQAIAGVDFKLLGRGVREISLDLDGLDTATGKGMVVHSVRLGEKELSFFQARERLTIRLDRLHPKGDSIRVEISYSGIPSDGLIISRNKFGDRTFFGDNWPDRAHDWLPVLDHPSRKATVDFEVEAPSTYRVVSNGRLESILRGDSGRTITRWKESVPISTKLMVIGVARFSVQYLPDAYGVPVETWVYPRDSLKGDYDFAVAGKVLNLYQKYLGPFPFEKCANVESTTRYGGMENASCIFYTEKEVTGKRANQATIAHEIAHQWFGDDVSEADWSQIWLSEGFAEFFEDFYTGSVFGKDSLAQILSRQKKMVFAYDRKEHAPLVDPSITRLNDLLNVNSYQKGALVLRMLEHRLGEKDFWDGLRLYHEKYRHGNAWTKDFRHCMEQESHKNLKRFFRQWVHVSGYPVLSWTWKTGKGGHRFDLSIHQMQAGPVFRIDPDLILYYGHQDTIVRRLDIRSRATRRGWSIPAEPDSVKLDPDQWILMDQKFQATGSRPR